MLRFYIEILGNTMNKIKEIENLIVPTILQEGMELVDLHYLAEHGKKVVRVFLDKPGGITLGDCEKMSDKLGAVLDKSNVVPDAYVLEVSSPGLDRVLKKDADFVRFKGQKARISVFAPIDGQRNFIGKIVAAGNGSVTLEDDTGKQVSIAVDIIARARLEPDISKM
jgi:ribosome maturation factor RimP